MNEKWTIDYDLLAEKIMQKLDLKCACGLSQGEQKEVRHFVSMVSDVGEGELAKGVECFRDIGKRFKRMSKLSDWLSKAILTALVLLTLSGLACAIKKGIEYMVKGVK